jgi:tetratricopeptide (TPR) repeat protein
MRTSMRLATLLLLLTCAVAAPAQTRGTRQSHAAPGLEDAPDPFATAISKDQTPAATSPGQSPILFDGLSTGIATVSAAELAIPPKAAKELLRSQKALEAGDVRESLRRYQHALEIYPPIPYAHNSLGVRYARLNEFSRALSEFQLASASNPEAAQLVHNLGATYYALQRFSEAETTMRRALDLDPNRLLSQFILASSLVMQQHFTSEAAQLLRKCTATIPVAHLMLAKVLLKQGETHEATAELREYLKTPHAQQKANAERLLAKLEAPSPNNAPSED